jgi:dienelactone hydrolase/ketosteroid isomerase-like protein
VKKYAVLFILFCVLSAAPALAQLPDARTELDYDASQPLGMKVLRSQSRGSIRIDEIEYASPRGGPVPALLVTPANGRRNAGVVFGHWGAGDRHMFLEEAIDLAARGTVSLLIDSATLRPAPWGKPDDGQYGEALVQNVVDYRRGVDLLVSRDDVDPSRLAYVGLSMGAHSGGILAGVDKRFAAFVLMGGTAQFSEFLRQGNYRRNLDAEQSKRFDAWVDRIARLDARHFVRNAAPARIFLQFTTDDEHVPLSEARAYYAAASDPKLMKWYDGGHELHERARRDRAEWLRTVIGIDDLSPANDERIAFPPGRGADLHALPAADVAKLSLVLEIPGMQHVPVRRDVVYKKVSGRDLKLDLYYPPGIAPQQKLPAVIIVGGQAHPTYMREMRSFAPMTSAARLVAASAQRVAIVYDIRSSASGPAPSERFTGFEDVRTDLNDLIEYLRANADDLKIDAQSLAIWARSAGSTYGTAVAWGKTAGVKAYVAYYPELDPSLLRAAGVPAATIDVSTMLPALQSGQTIPPTLIVTTSDATNADLQRLSAAKQRGAIEHHHLSRGQHAFDLFDDTEASRAALRMTLDFLHRNLPLAGQTAARPAPSQHDRDVETLRNKILTYADAVNRREPEPILPMFAPDILLSFPGIPDQDYATLRPDYESMRSRAPGEVMTRPEIEEILVSGDLAIIRALWHTTVTKPGNPPSVTTRQMKDLQVWRRESNGEWRFARGMHFRVPPVAGQ